MRFVSKIVVVNDNELDEIALAIGLCVASADRCLAR
jgi:hypothetical protein